MGRGGWHPLSVLAGTGQVMGSPSPLQPVALYRCEATEQPSPIHVASGEPSVRKSQAGRPVARCGRLPARRGNLARAGLVHVQPLLSPHSASPTPAAHCSPLGPQHGAATPQPAGHIVPAHFLHLQEGGTAAEGQARGTGRFSLRCRTCAQGQHVHPGTEAVPVPTIMPQVSGPWAGHS